MTDKQNFEKDINVPSKRLDRIDKMEIDLANYEQMERDIEKIIETYQLDWELNCLSLPIAIQSILERKEQECEELKEILKDKTDEYNKLAVNYDAYVSMANEQLDQLKAENGYLKRKISQYENLLKLDFTKCRTAEEEVEHANYLREQGRVVLTEENHKLKQTLTEIKEIARVNSINTCWSAMNLCADCDEIKECGLQSPFEKLKAIIQKISEVQDV